MNLDTSCSAEISRQMEADWRLLVGLGWIFFFCLCRVLRNCCLVGTCSEPRQQGWCRLSCHCTRRFCCCQECFGVSKTLQF